MDTETEFAPAAVTLEGAHVRLEPLGEQHAEQLFHASRDPEIWRYLTEPQFRQPEDTRAWIQAALRSNHVPFAIVQRATGEACGSTRYLDIRPAHRGLEIGWTWLAPAAQRTAINTECKYLLLRHAFETLGALRVQLKTDNRNQRSQRAIARLGAVREGVLRAQMRLWDGHLRDTVYFSIVRPEWPEVRARLEGLLAERAVAEEVE